MKKLLLLDYWRGTDSTGLAAIRKGASGVTSLAKVASHPLDLFDMVRFKTALSAYSSKAFIGHNRAATKGVVNNQNAHPYEFGDVTGAHNGTLTESSWKALEEALGEKTGTDSAAVIACIDKIGIEDTVKLMQGAWALVWFDRRDNTLNFLRNKERPFWYAYSKDFQNVYWASEHWMISAATQKTSKADYPLLEDDKGFSLYATQEDWHYKFDLDELSKATSQMKPKSRELKGKEPEPVKATTNFPQYGHQGSTRGVNGTGTTASRTYTGDVEYSVKVVENPVSDPFKGYFTVDKLKSITNFGCNWCREDVDIDDIGLVVFEAQELCLCGACSGRDSPYVYADKAHLNTFAKGLDDARQAA